MSLSFLCDHVGVNFNYNTSLSVQARIEDLTQLGEVDKD